MDGVDILSIVRSLPDVGADTTLPFVILAMGQSNMEPVVEDTGDKTNPANTFITNTALGGTALVPAVFGTAPLNSLNNNGGPAPGPAGSCNSMPVHFANALRAAGMIPASRPIVIILNAASGNPLANWIGAGVASVNWVALVASLVPVGAAYPGFSIDHMMWSQAEGDHNASGTPYASKSGYLGGYSTVLAQLRALSQWRADTTVSVQELGTWYDADHRDRNDAIRSMRSGMFDPYVTTVSSSNIPESTASPKYHFSGAGLVTLGHRHFEAWRAARVMGAYTPKGMGDYLTGGADVVRRALTVGSLGVLKVGDDDLRGGGCYISVTGTAADIQLPDPTISAPSEIFVYCTGDYQVDFIPLVGTVESDFAATTASLSADKARHYRVYNLPSANRWYVETLYPKFGVSKLYGNTNSTQTLSAAAYLNSIIHITGTATITTPTTGLRNGVSNCFYATAGNPVITSGAGAGFVYPGGRTVASITLSPSRWIATDYVSGHLTMDSGMWSRACQEATPTTGATVNCTDGIGELTLHLLHGSTIATLTIDLPVSPVDGAALRVVATSTVTALSWTGGTVGALVPTTLLAGQTALLTYSAASSTWR